MDIIRDILHTLERMLGRKVRGMKPSPWDLINVDGEFKKVEFKEENGGWYVYYNGKNVGGFNSSEMKSLKLKDKSHGYYFIYYKLQMMHPNFKNKKLNDLLAKKFMDILGVWK